MIRRIARHTHFRCNFTNDWSSDKADALPALIKLEYDWLEIPMELRYHKYFWLGVARMGRQIELSSID